MNKEVLDRPLVEPVNKDEFLYKIDMTIFYEALNTGFVTEFSFNQNIEKDKLSQILKILDFKITEEDE